MSLSTFNFRAMRVPLVAVMTGTALFLIYHFVIVTFNVQPGWVVSPFKLNEVAVERYACSTKPANIVAIGSSLLNRPSSRITVKAFENLCLKGYCALDGAQVILKTRRYPKLLIVELGHTLETNRRYNFEEELPSFRRALARVTPVVLTQYQPASLMVRYVQEACNSVRASKKRAKLPATTKSRASAVEKEQIVQKSRTDANTNDGAVIKNGIKSGTTADAAPVEGTESNTVNSTSEQGHTRSGTANVEKKTTDNTANNTSAAPGSDSDETKVPAPTHHLQTAGRVDLVDPSFLPPPRNAEERKSKEAAIKYAQIERKAATDPPRPDAPGSGQLPTAQRMSSKTRIRFLANLRRLQRYVRKFERHGTVVYLVSVPQSPAYMDSPRAEEHRQIFEEYFPKDRYNRLEWTGPKRYWNTFDGAHLTDEDAHLFARFLAEKLAPVWEKIARKHDQPGLPEK